MRRLLSILVATFCVSALWGTFRAASGAENLGFKVPPGFAVSLYADDDLAHDIYSMTIDAKGRVAVAGRGYVKILHDDNGDGRADRATLFSKKPASGAHGMYFDGPDLVCTGDDSLMRLRDTNDDGVADGEPEKWSRLRHPEHGANGVVKGPDGWFYVACGNDAEVTEKHASTPHSPVKKPNCGAIVRFSPDGKQSEIFAHGFRNPYDLDFNEHGHLFTVDADGERDQYLPWYTPTRLFDVAQGMHHGWVLRGWTRSWNRPAYFPDNVERLVEIGRGSPTGLVCYRHRAFPQKYRGGIFSACWTLGIIYYFPLTPKGSSYTSHKEIFMQTTGQTGFAPVDLAVGPSGDMFVAIGGRGTRGGVFRVRYRATTPIPPSADDILAADQPLSSWSRAKWLPLSRRLARSRIEETVTNVELPLQHRLRAVEVLTEVHEDVVLKPSTNESLSVVARTLWATGRWLAGNPEVSEAVWKRIDLVRRNALRYQSPAARRAAWEMMAALSPAQWKAFGEYNKLSVGAWGYGLGADDRRTRSAALLAANAAGVDEVLRQSSELIERLESFPVDDWALRPATRPQRVRLSLPWLAREKATNQFIAGADYFETCLIALRVSADPVGQLEALRLLQLACGDMFLAESRPDLYAGYAPARTIDWPEEARRNVVTAVKQALATTKDHAVSREAARLLGMLGKADPDSLLSVVTFATKQSSVEDDLHFLIVLSRLPGERSRPATLLSAVALIQLHHKVNALDYQVSRNWPFVVGEIFDELCKRDPGLAQAVVNDRDFGLSEHTLFAERMPKELRNKAARKIFDVAIKAQDAARWSAEMVALVGGLSDADVLPKLRELWEDEPGLRDSIALVLARSPVEDDRSRLVAALVSPDPKVIIAAAKSLRSLAKPGKPDEIADAMRMLREYCVPGKHAEVRQELVSLLAHWTDQRIAIDEARQKDLRAVYQPWFDWFAKTHPREAAKLAGLGEVDAAAWAKRLNSIDWTAGDAARGRKIFDARSCNRCHGGNSRLGPDLVGVTRRFSRGDLFASIIDPNKDVSPLYQTSQLTTKTGQTHVGILIYESPEGSLLQTGPDTTIRITDEDVAKRRPSRQSLMPTNLLTGATDQDLADLYAYMQADDRK
jgi:putative membrane-bound dehydrogenase-like protein